MSINCRSVVSVTSSAFPDLPSSPKVLRVIGAPVGPVVLDFETGAVMPILDGATTGRYNGCGGRASVAVDVGGSRHQQLWTTGTRKRNLEDDVHGRQPRKRQMVVSASGVLSWGMSPPMVGSSAVHDSVTGDHFVVQPLGEPSSCIVPATISTVTTASREPTRDCFAYGCQRR